MLKFFFFGLLIAANSFVSALSAQTDFKNLERLQGKWVLKTTKEPFTGDFVEYSETQKLISKGTMLKGSANGKHTVFHENGRLKVERKYEQGKAVGESVEYFENGNIKQKGVFNPNGREHGVWTVNYENGQPRATITYENGVQQGDYSEYAPDKTLRLRFYFENGKAGYAPEFIALTNQALELSKTDPRGAILLYDKAIEQNPTVAQAYFNRATCKSGQFKFADAIKDYDLTLQYDPKHAYAYANRGTAKINLVRNSNPNAANPSKEQAASACEDFKKALELGDTSVEDMIWVHCR
jgi:tetratricopeptide (TPR) repeat protein